MSVELLILSGARQGEQLRFRTQNITVGAEQACDVCFDVAQHPLASGKVAEFVADEYGWRIRNCGLGDWYVNQDMLPTSGASPLRSGDIVRLSELGPDLRFSIVADHQIAAEDESSDVSANEEFGASERVPDEREEAMPSNTYTVLVPILVLLLMLLIVAVGALMVLVG